MFEHFHPFNKKLGYFGWTGMRNLGDEALFEAVKNLLYPISVFNHVQFYGKGKFITHALENYFFSGMLMGAGTLINSPNYLEKMKRFQDKKVRTFIFGAGVLDPDIDLKQRNWSNRMKEWVEVLNNCEHVSVRGPLSQKILFEYGYKNFEVCGDPVFGFAEATVRKIKRRKVIGLNIGTTCQGKSLYGNSDEKVAKFAKGLCRVLVSKGYKIILFPVWSKDEDIVKEIARDLEEGAQVFNSKCDYSLYMDKLKEVDILIGEKLHSVILALCTYTPSIMLAYAPKCEDVMSSIGLMDYSIRTDALQIEKVLYLINTIEEDIESYQNKLFSTLKIFRERLIDNANKLKKNLQC